MSSKIYIKRSSIQGKAPTTSNLGTGELALNLRDAKLFAATASEVFEIGSNVTSSTIGSLTIGNSSPYILPSSDGNPGQFLKANANGTVTFSSVANTFSIGNPASYHVYTVTVSTKTSAHPYTGQGSASAYFLDGEESPSIILAPNQTYRFDQSDSSNSNHPVLFYRDAAKTVQYTTGITTSGTPGSAGAYTEIVVDQDTPQVLYYQCSNHAYMGSVASVLSETSPKYLEVANVVSIIANNTTKYLEVANAASAGTNTSISNVAFTSANNNLKILTEDSRTFSLDLSALAGGGGVTNGAVIVANSSISTGDGSTTTFSSPISTTNEEQVLVTVDGIVQRPQTDYTISGTTVTLAAAPLNNSIIMVKTAAVSSTNFTTGSEVASGDGSTTTFTSPISTTDDKDILVTVDGIMQRPTTDYTVSGTTVTFGTPPLSGTTVMVRTAAVSSHLGSSTINRYIEVANVVSVIANNTTKYLEVANATSTDTDIYLEVANVSSYGFASNTYAASNTYVNQQIGNLVGNTASNTAVQKYLEVANASVYLEVANVNSRIANQTTKFLEVANVVSVDTDPYLEVANASVYLQVSNAAGIIANNTTQFLQVANISGYSFATESFVQTEIAAVVNSAPGTLDTLNELAAALGDDANFSTTVTTNLSQKLGATATVALTGDVTAGATAFSGNAVSLSTTVSSSVTNPYLEVANASVYLEKANASIYLEVANVNASIANQTTKFLEVANVVSVDTDPYLEVANASVYLEVANISSYGFASNTYAASNTYVNQQIGNLVANTASNTAVQKYLEVANVSSYGFASNTYAASNTYVNQQIGNLVGNTASNTAVQKYLEVSNAAVYLEKANASIYLEVANVNARIANQTTKFLEVANVVTVDTDPYLEVANISSFGFASNTYAASNSYVNQQIGNLVANTASNTALENYLQVANADIYLEKANASIYLEKANASIYLEVANANILKSNTFSFVNPDNYHIYTITVDTKTSAHPYTGQGSGNAYFLDGIESPSIVLAPNQTYRFDQSDSTNSGHPLLFYRDAAKTVQYTTGITTSGTPGSAGAYTQVVVDKDMPQILYYQCSAHAYMGSIASILSDTSLNYLEVANASVYLEVANAAGIIANNTTKYLEVANVVSIIANNTTKYLEVANASSAGTNTSISNVAFTSANNNLKILTEDSRTFSIDLSSLAGGGGGDNTSISNVAFTSANSNLKILTQDSRTFSVDLSALDGSSGSITPQTSTGTANGTATTFTSPISTTNENEILVTVDGVLQTPQTDYTVSGTTVTLDEAPENNSSVVVRTAAVSAVTVTNTSISNVAFTSANNNLKILTDDSRTFSVDLSGLSVSVTNTSISNVAFTSANSNLKILTEDSRTFSVDLSDLSGGSGSITPQTSTSAGDGSTTTFTSPISTTDENEILVTVDGVMQRPQTDYTVSGTTVTFGTAPLSGTTVMVRTATVTSTQTNTSISNVAFTSANNNLKILTEDSRTFSVDLSDLSGGSSVSPIAMAMVFG